MQDGEGDFNLEIDNGGIQHCTIKTSRKNQQRKKILTRLAKNQPPPPPQPSPNTLRQIAEKENSLLQMLSSAKVCFGIFYVLLMVGFLGQ